MEFEVTIRNMNFIQNINFIQNTERGRQDPHQTHTRPRPDPELEARYRRRATKVSSSAGDT